MTVLRGVLTTWPGRMLAIVLVAVVAGGAVVASRVNAEPAKQELRTQAVTRGSVTQTVAVSGSVAAQSQVKMSFKSQGKISAIYVSVGQQVTAGQPLAKLDTADLESALAQAEASLATAQNNYNRTASGSGDAQRSLDQAREQAARDNANAEAALNKLKASYAAAKSNWADLTAAAVTDIRTFQASLGTIESQVDALIALMSRIVGEGDTGDLRTAYNAVSAAKTPALENARANSQNLLTPALAEYDAARSATLSLLGEFESAVAAGADTTAIAGRYQLAQTSYAIATSRLTSALDTTSSVLATIQTNVTTAQTALNTPATRVLHVPFDQWRADLATLYALVTGEQQRVATAKLRLSQGSTSLNTVSDAVNGSYVSAVQNVATTAQRGLDTIESARSSVNAKPYDLANAQTSVDNAASAVETAKLNLANAVVTAPTAGVVASIASAVGETAANPFMTLANTSSMVLHGTVGESEVAKMRLALVANVTVDAVGSGARMTGKVTSLDPVATIQQGVPVYGIDVTIDLPNAQVKPGMTGTANVIVASKQDVLTVPNLAIRSAAGRRYVQVLKGGEAVDADVSFGIANDTVTEVLSGLAEGDLVVLPQPRGTATQAPRIGPGGGGVQVPVRP
jgi:HlyD family secretion protein